MLSEFLLWAKQNNWNVISCSDMIELPDAIKSRYDIPAQWYDFICTLQVCENPKATKWFLTPNDYLPQEDCFQWNEFEMQSLEYGNNESDVTSYWNHHLPIFMTVDSEYSYFAINTENGNVVIGYEPEYEVPTVVAEDFNSFISKIIFGEIEL